MQIEEVVRSTSLWTDPIYTGNFIPSNRWAVTFFFLRMQKMKKIRICAHRLRPICMAFRPQTILKWKRSGLGHLEIGPCHGARAIGMDEKFDCGGVSMRFLDASYKNAGNEDCLFFGGKGIWHTRVSTLGDSAEVHGDGTSSGNTQQLGCNPYCRGEPMRFECGQTIKNQDQREDSMNGW